MEWVECVAETVAEAKERALDALGVSEEDAEFVVVDEPSKGLLGRRRGEARVRARKRSPVSSKRRKGRHTKASIPDALTDLLREGTTVLVAGTELPTVRGAPGLAEVLLRATDIADESLGDAGRERLQSMVDGGNFESIVRLLRSQMPDLDGFVAHLYQNNDNADAYGYLAQTSLAGVISMTWDPMLLDAFLELQLPVAVVDATSNRVLDAARGQDFTFTWMTGDPKRPPLALSALELRSSLAQNETFARFVGGIVQSSPLLFLGTRVNDIAEFFDVLLGSSGSLSSKASPLRFAVCTMDDDLWQLNVNSMRSSYGVELIGYDPDDIGSLARLIEEISYSARPIGSDGSNLSGAAPDTRLTHIQLENIGVFNHLELELSPAWNLLLGNNGCGKSTVLRAVALGLVGDHPRAMEAGQELLRAGANTGLIELQVGATRYLTELSRTSDGSVRVTTNSLTPLQQGSWVVLGFPALRGMSLTGPSGISAPTATVPQVEDLLPLLFGEVDHRLDDIKQWIINLDARSTRDDARGGQLLARFFDVLSDLTPGLKFDFAHVDTSNWHVLVRTDDGVVPIDQLSQGMSSIIAWVGTLLQRMYDIYPQSPEPAHEQAFVLIDELDAHLHPEWQQRLTELSRTHFPKVQYLATSHSPLLAANLAQEELFVAKRMLAEDSDGTEYLMATIEPAEVDPHGLRADQILTSPLFDLMTSRSLRFQADAKRYDQLFITPARTPAEESEFAQLRELMKSAYTDGETLAQRQAVTERHNAVQARLESITDEAQSVAELDEMLASGSSDGDVE